MLVIGSIAILCANAWSRDIAQSIGLSGSGSIGTAHGPQECVVSNPAPDERGSERTHRIRGIAPGVDVDTR